MNMASHGTANHRFCFLISSGMNLCQLLGKITAAGDVYAVKNLKDAIRRILTAPDNEYIYISQEPDQGAGNRQRAELNMFRTVLPHIPVIAIRPDKSDYVRDIADLSVCDIALSSAALIGEKTVRRAVENNLIWNMRLCNRPA